MDVCYLGTGKTFLYSLILSRIRSHQHIALAVAGSGVASLLLPGGRTVHSRFKVPVQMHEDAACNIGLGSDLAELIISARVIVWDEAPMTHRHIFEAVDRSFRDVMKSVDPLNNNLPFGGKIMVFGGDFRQIPPVIKRCTREQTIAACLKRSPSIWTHVKTFKLDINMRLLKSANAADIDMQTWFADWLLQVGNGETMGLTKDDGISKIIQLPQEMVMPVCEKSLDNMINLITTTYPNLQGNIDQKNIAYFNQRALLTPKNEDVDALNNYILSTIFSQPGDTKTFFSDDSICDSFHNHARDAIYPIEFLNGINLPSLPPHQLKLAVGCPIILLRNLFPLEGLCNGTRLICTKLHRKVLCAVVISGTHAGQEVFIPRIPIIPPDLDMPFKLRRLQFPVRPAFAITINKAQGQTLEHVGLYLKTPVFVHGQLYVALSRVTSLHNVHVLIEKDRSTPYEISEGCTTNVVYPEILY